MFFCWSLLLQPPEGGGKRKTPIFALISIQSRHRLRSRLQRYLIVFAPSTNVLDQSKRSCRTPPLQFVLAESQNFTSSLLIQTTPIARIHHCHQSSKTSPVKDASLFFLKKNNRGRTNKTQDNGLVFLFHALIFRQNFQSAMNTLICSR